MAGERTDQSATGPGVGSANGTAAATKVGTATARSEAFARGPERIPRRFTMYLVAGVVILGVGGVILGRVFTAVGLNPVGAPAGSQTSQASITPASLPSSKPSPRSPVTASPPSPFAELTSPLPGRAPVDSRVSALMDLTALAPNQAPPVSLTSGGGSPLSLKSFEGKVVVLSFFDASCNDICPVLGAEIAQADRDLGSNAGRVEFVSVNSDPTSPETHAAGARVFGARPTPANWVFASGSVGQLNRVWSAYGITVDVVRSSGAVSHNDLLYFMDPSGRLRYVSTPFADEAPSGAYTLPATTVSSWAQGIADVATGLLR